MMRVNWVDVLSCRFFGEVSIFPAQKSIDFSQTACLKITDLSGKKKTSQNPMDLLSFSVYHLHINDLTLVTREKHAK